MTAQVHRAIRTDGTTAETAQTVLAAWVELELPLPAPTTPAAVRRWPTAKAPRQC